MVALIATLAVGLALIAATALFARRMLRLPDCSAEWDARIADALRIPDYPPCVPDCPLCAA